MAVSDGCSERIGAVLLAFTLLLPAWLASRTTTSAASASTPDGIPVPKRLPAPWGEGRPWNIDATLRAEILARLPAAFELRARAAREHLGALAVPSLQGYTVSLRGGTRTGDQRMVKVDGECNPVSQVAAVPVLAPGDATPTPEPARMPSACFFGGAYDPDGHRFVYLSFSGFEPTYEFGKIDCVRDRFRAVTLLADLPAEVRSALRGPLDLAEHDAPLQVTDVVTDPNQASRRFALAAIDDDRAIVAVEHGGYAYGIEVWLLEQRNGHWDGEPRWQGAQPNSLQGLLHTACAGVPAPPTRGLITADVVYGFEEPDGLHLIVANEPGPGYILRNRSGHDGGEIVTDVERDKRLSSGERRALRRHLLALRAEVLSDQPAYAHLSRFLNVLDRDPGTGVSH